MAQFAVRTTVPVDKSKAEIERLVSRYGATGFASGWQGPRAIIQFVCRGRHTRFTMELPDRTERRFTQKTTGYGARSETAAQALWDQACRQKWRALTPLVKAKLEAVDANIASFEEAFFADIVMPDGRTVYESAREPVAPAYASGRPVALLGAPQ